MGIVGSTIVKFLPLAPKFIVRWFAKRYFAGEDLNQALKAINKISLEGACFTIDVLGEEINSMDETAFFISEYERVIELIVEHNLNSNISIKPTAFGLHLDFEIGLSNMISVISKASDREIFVRLDMEDSSATQYTIDALTILHDMGYSNVGIVFQGRLHRTLADIQNVTEKLGNKCDIRICKGIYLEPEKIAFTNHSKIVEETNSAIQLSIKNGAYVAIASHDDPVINFSLNEISNAGMGPGIDDPRPNSNPSRIGKGPGYEFQFLMGVRGDVRRKLSNEGHLTRVYLPYGARWYEYSMRRLRENPDVALHITKAVLFPWTNRR